jgi:hypothetical protein
MNSQLHVKFELGIASLNYGSDGERKGGVGEKGSLLLLLLYQEMNEKWMVMVK